jgi:hypothetical protein
MIAGENYPIFGSNSFSAVSANNFWRFFLAAENYSTIFSAVFLAAKNIIDLFSVGFS